MFYIKNFLDSFLSSIEFLYLQKLDFFNAFY